MGAWVGSGRWNHHVKLRGAVGTYKSTGGSARRTPAEFEALHTAVRDLCIDFADANWTAWAHAMHRYQKALLWLGIAHAGPHVKTGKAVHEGPKNRQDAIDKAEVRDLAGGHWAKYPNDTVAAALEEREHCSVFRAVQPEDTSRLDQGSEAGRHPTGAPEKKINSRYPMTAFFPCRNRC